MLERYPGLRASQQAPITALDGKDLGDAIAHFLASLDGWKVKSKFSFRSLFLGSHDRRVWNSRIKDIRFALGFVRADATNVAYKLADQPVGLMSASRQVDPASRTRAPFLEIHALVSHPGARASGGAWWSTQSTWRRNQAWAASCG